MGIRATVISNTSTRISLNNQEKSKVVKTIGIVGSGGGVERFVDLSDVDASNLGSNEVPVWDSANNKFVIETIPFLDGGVY